MKLKNKFYAGIGSRDTPEHIQNLMREIATLLERRKYTLRSGGALGADLAFEGGVIKNKEIFYKESYRINDGYYVEYDDYDLEFATKILKQYHPSYKPGGSKIKNKAAIALLTRNTFQIFGVGTVTENSEFVICYTQDGAETVTTYDTGGTGQAIRIAYDYGIPVYNLKNYIGVPADEMVEFIMKEMQEK
jgi:hypothetical protein